MDGLYRARGGKPTVLADDRPVAKKVAWAVLSAAQGSELGFTETKAAARCEVGRRAGLEAAITSHASAICRRLRSPWPAGWSREILWDMYASPRWAREVRASLPGHGAMTVSGGTDLCYFWGEEAIRVHVSTTKCSGDYLGEPAPMRAARATLQDRSISSYGPDRKSTRLNSSH